MILALLALLVTGAYLYSQNQPQPETISANTAKVVTADGDSFAIGTRKLRLKGIDAPEYKQICRAADGKEWPCGRSAKAALENLLTQPGLSCSVEYHDRFARSLAYCRTSTTPDIGAAQVSNGMAVSDDFNGLRSFGAEEDAAKSAKRGIWQGRFIVPKLWRETHSR
jgi:endonuclease YncB( thermonuclease family)